jgi:hypothetical protein
LAATRPALAPKTQQSDRASGQFCEDFSHCFCLLIRPMRFLFFSQTARLPGLRRPAQPGWLGLGVLALALLTRPAAAQTGIGTTSPAPQAALDISATDKGLLIPRLTAAQRQAIASPPTGLMVFQTDGAAGFWYYFAVPATTSAAIPLPRR